ncbi:MAG: hypothetical protein LC114_22135 [Bryobacterales bacterium]|nr:hypothetical protein [Bryobacterales bacterium]
MEPANAGSARALSGDLDNIVLKCSRNDPKIATARLALALIARYLDGHIPCPAGNSELPGCKVLRRNAWQAAVGAASRCWWRRDYCACNGKR